MKEPVLLLVENDENDAWIFCRRLRKAVPACVVQYVSNGAPARDYLNGNRPYGDRKKYPFPSVVVLDLHLLAVSGFELLAWARQYPRVERPADGGSYGVRAPW